MESNIFKIGHLVVIFFLCISPLRAQIATSALNETFFIKAGVGSYLSQLFFTNYYNRPDENGISPLVDDTIHGVSGFAGSAAAGIDWPDHFSLFVSGERLTDDWSIMTNVQYTFTKFNLIKPYLYFGLGVDFSTNSAIGGCAQLGLGTNFALTQSFNVFVETKVYVSNVYWTSSTNPLKDFVQWAGYFPILTGIKLNL